MPLRLILVRHGRVGAEHVGRLIGASDVPLGAAGHRQARALADRVRSIGYDRCYASPLLRCLQTVEAISPVVPIRWDEDLREIHFGRWEQHTFEEAAAGDPALAERWAAFDRELTFPEGENLGRFLCRVQAAADRLTIDDAENILAVSHGGVIRMMLCYLLGLEFRQYLAFHVDYGTLAVIEVFGRRGVLSRLEPCQVREDADG